MKRSLPRCILPAFWVVVLLTRPAQAQEDVFDPKPGPVTEESGNERNEVDSVSRTTRRWEVGFQAGTVAFAGAETPHRALGIGFIYHLSRRFAVAPEFLYMWAPVACRGALPISSSPGGGGADFYVDGGNVCTEGGGYDRDFMLTTDLVYSFKDPDERYVPYLSVGFGVIQTRLKTVRVTTPWYVWNGTSWVPEDIEPRVIEASEQLNWWWIGGGGGIRIRLADHLHVSPELRIGRESVFLAANVTYSF